MNDRDQALSRPAARIGDGGGLEVRASAAMGCRRALWYAATAHEATNPPADESVTVMEAGTALEPVVLRAMEQSRLGDLCRRHRPRTGVGRAGPRPDGIRTPGRHRAYPGYRRGAGRDRGQDPGSVRLQALADHGRRDQPPGIGRTGGRLHARPLRRGRGRPSSPPWTPASRGWDFESIPPARVTSALAKTRAWLAPLAEHLRTHGPDPDALPERDFGAGSWRCGSCPVPGAVPARRCRAGGRWCG